MGIEDRRRHQRRGLVAGIAEHDALIAGTFILIAGGVDALRDVGRLRMDMHLDLGVLPREAFLIVADILDGGARRFFHHPSGDRSGAADFAGQHDTVGGRQGFHRDAGIGIGTQEGIDDGVGDPVAHLVGMTFRHGLAGEQIVGPGQIFSPAGHGTELPKGRS